MFRVMMRLGATPVPLPITMVKTQSADEAWWEAAWENRGAPEAMQKDCGLIAQLVRARA